MDISSVILLLPTLLSAHVGPMDILKEEACWSEEISHW